ncbi:Uncharacterized protein Adt_38017 [Abeliophyllum distichum]|uniref:Uncharacterized protein n=1 Tax=Abeliophyllum distichum TaxID=126358 RepID=A0ABD1Q114_9LAMI
MCLNPSPPPSGLAGTTTTTTTTFLRRNHQCHHRGLLLSSSVSTTTPISYPKLSTISSNPLQSSLTLNLFCPYELSNAAVLRRTSIFWCLNPSPSPPPPPSGLAGTTTTIFLRRNHQCHHRDLLLSSPVSTTTPISHLKSSTISSNPFQSSLTLNLFCPSEPSNAAALRRTSIFWFWNDLRAYDRNWKIEKIGEGCGDSGGLVLGCGLSDCRGGPTLVRVR